RCIHRTLQCNGEDDCGDMSDEAGCQRVSKPCRVEAEEYWGIENLAKGAKAELELAQYFLKPDGLVLHPEFLQRLRSLPQAYVYGEYRQIYRDYGTHYITEATLGGDMEYTIILNKENLEKSEDTKNGAMVEDFVAVVRGGSSQSITALLSQRLPSPQLMRLWGEGVRYNPDFIRITDASLKRNLKRALSEYLAETSSCRCAPCLNNGVAVLKGIRLWTVSSSPFSFFHIEIRLIFKSQSY
ncbi:hypothetical protein GOODEAATRI_007919, partial [Goodea atripinnis]